MIDAVANGVGQVVLIAAGMDTRAFRLALPAEVIVFELDLAELLAQKQGILEREHASPTADASSLPLTSPRTTGHTR